MATTTILEKCEISPLADHSTTVPMEFTLPMIYLDTIWYDFPPTQLALFFEFPSCSKSHFLDAIVPRLKTSLSLTLSHFLPFAGNIIHPLNRGTDQMPTIRYQAGDSVALTVSEFNGSTTSKNLNYFTGDHPRLCYEFHAFVPELPPATHSETSITCPIFAAQVTLFPGQGLCVGIVTRHAVSDAPTAAAFILAWALINKSSCERLEDSLGRLIENNSLPFYDRRTVTNICGLDSINWDMILKFSTPVEPLPWEFPANYLRATFVLKKDDIQKLKHLVLAKYPSVAHLSSFTVVCALTWVCLAKSSCGGDDLVPAVDDDEPDYLIFSADCRGRLDPPLPPSYFGNCVILLKSVLKHGELKGVDGLTMAAKTIGDAIKEKLYNKHKKGVLHGAEKMKEEFYGESMVGRRQHGVVGTPRADFYAADYGWGKPNKCEVLFIDDGRSFSLLKSRKFEGGVEIGLSKPAAHIQAFTTFFNLHLRNLSSEATF